MSMRSFFPQYLLLALLGAALSSAATCAEPKESLYPSVSGTVVDASGRPVPSATVWLHEWTGDGQFNLRNVKCGAKGEFAFEKIASTYVTLAVLAEGHSYGGMHLQDLPPGKLKKDLRLVVTEPRELLLHVVDEDGNPVRDVEIDTITWKAPSAEPFSFPLEVLRRERIPLPRSDKRGELSIADVPAGCECEVRLKHPDFARRVLRGLSSDSGKPVKAVIPYGNAVTVEVIEAATGKPARGASISLTGSRQRDEDLYNQPVDGNGQWTTRVSDPRTCSINVRHPTLVARQSPRIFEGERDADGGYRLRIAMVRTAKVTGRVVDDKGQPVAGAFVTVAIERRAGWYSYSDAAGAFAIEAPEGEASVLVMSRNGVYTEKREGIPIKLTAGVTNAAPDLVVLRLPRVRGRVVLPDGRPAARALVQSGEGPLSYAYGMTDDSGAFELAMERKPDWGAAVIATDISQRLSSGVTVSFDALRRGEPLRIELQAESALRGVLKGADGRAIAGRELSIEASLPLNGGSVHFPVGAVRTNERGEYRFPGLCRHMRYRTTLGWGLEQVDRKNPPLVRADDEEITYDVTLDAEESRAESERAKPKSKAPYPAPELACRAWLNSPPLSLKSLRGKMVVIDFSLQREGKELQMAHELFAAKGIVVLSVLHTARSAEHERKLISERKLTFPVALDNAQNETFGRYGLRDRSLPVIIGRDGRVITGELPSYDLLGTLRRYALYGEPHEWTAERK
jgi:protocatechuate 3,4-dioxygenase beta subunit